MKAAMPRRCAGWTAVELIVSLVLGLIVMLLASGLLLAANSNYRHHSESAWLDDGGRYALDIMGQAIRQGAYVNWERPGTPLEADAAAGVAGLDARSLSRASAGIETPLPAVANGSDVLALRFAGVGEGGNGDGSSVNCAGFGVAAPASGQDRGWSIFYVAADASGEMELRCKYRGANGWGADAIVRGVDTFQVLYGLDTDTPADGVPNTYVQADAINALDAALPLVGATAQERQRERNRLTYWKRVCSVRLALLLHGDANSRPDSEAVQFDVFGKAYADGFAAQDPGVRIAEQNLPPALQRRARRVFGTTIAVRNRSG